MDKFALKAINSKIPKKFKVMSIKTAVFDSQINEYVIAIKKGKEKDLYINRCYIKTEQDPIEEIINKLTSSTNYEKLFKVRRITLKKRVRK